MSTSSTDKHSGRGDSAALGTCTWPALIISIIALLLLLTSCGTGSVSDSTQSSGVAETYPSTATQENGEASAQQAEEVHSLINVRNATYTERLPHVAMTLLQQSGFSYGEGYSFDIEVAYESDSPMRLDESFIVIKENREDLKEAAEAIRGILGRGTIVAEDSNVEGWRYGGDILLVLGTDCLDSQSGRVLFSSDDPDYPETQQTKYLVSIRNATEQRFLADSTMKRLDAAGLSYEEGYIYTIGNAYHRDYPIRLAESSLIIKENREDLREMAETMREILGTGTIIEENSGRSWEYDGDILIVLGRDCIVSD